MEPYARRKKSLPVFIGAALVVVGVLLVVAVFGVYQAIRTPETQVAQQIPSEPVVPEPKPLPPAEPPESAPPSDEPLEPAEETLAPSAELEALQDTWPARHLFIAVKGYTVAPETASLLTELKPGGVALGPQNIRDQKQTTKLVQQIKAAVGLGGDAASLPLIAVDHEGKAVNRLKLSSPTPGAADLGANRDLDAARQAGITTAKSCLARGIGVLLGPVLDIATATTPAALRGRIFSDDRTVVSALGLAFADGVVQGGVIPVAKHYPGRGASASASTAELAVLPGEVSAAEVLFPFVQAAQVEVPGILAGHIAVPELDKDFPDRPASISPVLIRDFLRVRRQYDGVVLADDVSVRAVTATRSVEQAAVEALAAGCDAVLMLDPDPGKIRAVCAAMGEAVENGILSRRDLSASKRRLDAWQDLLREPRPGLKTPLPELSPVQVASTEQALTEGTVTGAGKVTTYTVVSGDNLTKIAKNFGVSLDDLRRWNPGLTPALKIGDKISIGAEEPAVAAPAEEAAAVPPAETPPQPVESPAPETGAVKEATTETPALQESRPEGAPGVEPTTELPVEAPAAIAPPPEVAEDVPPPDTNPITHVVKPGEYLSGIASKYDVKYQDIMKWNHLTEVKITPGDKLTIHVAKNFVLPATEALAATDAPAPAKTPAEPQPAPETAVAQPAPPTSAPVEAPSPQPPVEGMVDAPATESGEGPQAEAAPYLPEIKYSVQPRDALAKIADRYGVTVDELKEWNGRTSDDLKIGEVLIIHPRKMPTP